MTILATVEWKCNCGHLNETQLWTLVWDHGDEHYQNDAVPDSCDLNQSNVCEKCGSFMLADDYHTNEADLRGWAVVSVKHSENWREVLGYGGYSLKEAHQYYMKARSKADPENGGSSEYFNRIEQAWKEAQITLT